MRDRQRGKRGGMGEVLAFVRRMTQDTAFGGMRTSPQAALFVPSEYQKALLPKGRRAFWHPQRESNSQLPLRRGLLYPFNYAGIYLFRGGGYSYERSEYHGFGGSRVLIG